jgi:hypothetical protein
MMSGWGHWQCVIIRCSLQEIIVVWLSNVDQFVCVYEGQWPLGKGMDYQAGATGRTQELCCCQYWKKPLSAMLPNLVLQALHQHSKAVADLEAAAAMLPNDSEVRCC